MFISINDICNFSSCSYRLKFNGNTSNEILKPEYLLFRSILNDGLLYKAKNNTISLSYIRSSLGTYWQQLKADNMIAVANADYYNFIHQRSHSLFRFLDSLGEIILVNDNFSTKLDHWIIDSSLASLSRSDDNILHYTYLCNSTTTRFTENSILSLVFKYLSKHFSKDLKGQYKYKVHIYKSLNGNVDTLEEDIDMRLVAPIIKNLLSNIESGNYYPNSSYETCSSCLFNSSCEWKSNR